MGAWNGIGGRGWSIGAEGAGAGAVFQRLAEGGEVREVHARGTDGGEGSA